MPWWQRVSLAVQPFAKVNQRVPIILGNTFVAGQQPEPRQGRTAARQRKGRILLQARHTWADAVFAAGVGNQQAIAIIDRQVRRRAMFLPVNAGGFPIQPEAKRVHVIRGRRADDQGLAVTL